MGKIKHISETVKKVYSVVKPFLTEKLENSGKTKEKLFSPILGGLFISTEKNIGTKTSEMKIRII